ncbi:MAG: oligosaccharide flippase family protein [Waterburya sp.]
MASKLQEKIGNGFNFLWQGKSSYAATIQTFIAKILIIGINVATGVITARFLGAAGRGEQAAIIMWPQFLAYTLTLGLPTATIYNFKNHPNRKSELFAAILFLGTGLGLIAATVGIIFIPSWMSQYSPEVITVAQIFMLFAPTELLISIFTTALEAEEKFTLANQLRYIAPLLTLILLLVLVFCQLMTPVTAGLSYLLPSLLVFLVVLSYFWRYFQPRLTGIVFACKLLLSYGLRSYGIDLLGTLSFRLAQALVVGLLTPSALGLYTVALSVSRMLDILQSSIVVVLLPKATALPLPEVIKLTSKVARISTFLSCLASLLAIIFSPILLQLFYGSEFLDAVMILRILLIEVAISGLTWILAQSFMALGKPSVVTILQGVGLGLSFPMMLILIPQYGMVGAGLALLASTTMRLIFILSCYPLILKVSPPRFIPKLTDWQLLQQMIGKKI